MVPAGQLDGVDDLQATGAVRASEASGTTTPAPGPNQLQAGSTPSALVAQAAGNATR